MSLRKKPRNWMVRVCGVRVLENHQSYFSYSHVDGDLIIWLILSGENNDEFYTIFIRASGAKLY